MPPITKIWHCILKDEPSLHSTAFQTLFSDILDLISTYSNPEGGPNQMHVLYQDINSPSRLFMITGYPSQELNTQTDKIYAEKFLPSMFEFVRHVWLQQLDIDVTSLPLEEQVTLAYGANSSAWKDQNARGGWDVWPDTAQAPKNASGERGTRNLESEDRVWVQVSKWDDANVQAVQPKDGESVQLRKITGK